MSNNEGGLFFAVGAFFLAIFGIGYAASKEKQINKLAKTVGMSAKHLVDADQLDIRDSMIRKAVDDAVARETNSRFDRISSDILNQAKNSLKSSVSTLVNKEVDNAKKGVTDLIVNRIRSIDITSVIDDIKDSVEEKLTEKIDDKLDDIADDLVDECTGSNRVVIIRK